MGKETIVNPLKIIKQGKKGIKKVAKKTNQATRVLTTGGGGDNVNDMGMGGIATNTFLKSVEEQHHKVVEKQKKLRRLRNKSSKLRTEKWKKSADGKTLGGPDGNTKQSQENVVLTVKDPFNQFEVGDLVSRCLKPLNVDVRSIGGTLMNPEVKATNENILINDKDKKDVKVVDKVDKRLYNECLFTMRIGKFDVTGGENSSDNMLVPGVKKVAKKAKNKLRYVCIVRSSNSPLLASTKNNTGKDSKKNDPNFDDNEDDNDSDFDGSESGDYDTMFNPDSDEENEEEEPEEDEQNQNLSMADKIRNKVHGEKKPNNKRNKTLPFRPDLEIASFPYIVLMALHADGTCPDYRRIITLSQLTGIIAPNSSVDGNNASKTNIKLTFKTGEVVTIDLNLPAGDIAASGDNKKATDSNLRSDSFLWSLLQIHTILCTSVVERYLSTNPQQITNALPFLTTQNLDKAELQYSSTVNGFLSDSPILFALLERQRKTAEAFAQANQGTSDTAEKENAPNEVDNMAYDMMMGNYSRYALFTSPEEELYAEEILNSTPWSENIKAPYYQDADLIDPSYTHEALTTLLQTKMRDLEAETCRRLIAWEDEKYSTNDNSNGNFLSVLKNTVKRVSAGADTLSLLELADALDALDKELGNMEAWLEDRAEAIEPLTRDCHEIEEENRQLEQQFKSFEMLGEKLYQILFGLEITSDFELILKDPKSVLQLDAKGNVDIFQSEEGVSQIHDAGRALYDALAKANDDKFFYLHAIEKQAQLLLGLAKSFSDNIARIVVHLMEQLASSHISDLEMGKIAKDDSHTTMVKKLRDTQKRFHGSLLLCFKMLEVLYLLHPELLLPMRDAYAALVVEGILSKKRVKRYFTSLPFRQSGVSQADSMKLSDYHAIGLRPGGNEGHHDTSYLAYVNTEDVQLALTEMLPVIAREAYFCAVIFGPPGDKILDGREKKRNFEATKKAVDRSSTWFRYYMYRVCGITQEITASGKEIAEKKGGGVSFTGNAMLALISSMHLNEVMEHYIDREKKGGVQSLSLAYVRATIFDLRKKVDKEWSSWVEEQIKWIRTNHGVPTTGKRAGVFESFSKFPCYLDHVIGNAKRSVVDKNQKPPALSKIKFVSYYLQKMAGELFASLHECAERETTDQQYAANVMRMENSYFFLQTIKHRGDDLTALFEKQLQAANTICKKSTDSYLGWMVKREFKQLHNLFSNISRIRKDVGDADVPIHVPKGTFIKTLAKECNREILKEKVKIIYSRMEKHLSDSSGLLPVTWKALVKVLYEWFGRWEKLSSSCYSYKLEPSAVDVVRIAKAAAGAATSSNVNASSQNIQDQNAAAKSMTNGDAVKSSARTS